MLNRGLGRDELIDEGAVATPGIFGPAYFEEIRDVLTASAGGPPDVVALLDVMRRHGLTPA